jgi:hypothetical protein
LTFAIAGDAVTELLEAAQLFDIDVDDFAGVLPFVTPDRLGRLQGSKFVEPPALEDAAHGRRRDMQFSRDLLSGVTPAAQGLDGIACGLRRLAWQ